MPKRSCLCGAVQYSTRGTIEGIDHCHCSMCRRSHGSAFSTYGRIVKEDLVIDAGNDQVERYQSSDAVTRSFCRTCGSSLFFKHAGADAFEFIAIGTLDEDPGGRPETHIFVGSKADWYVIEDDLPQHEEYPHGIAD